MRGQARTAASWLLSRLTALALILFPHGAALSAPPRGADGSGETRVVVMSYNLRNFLLMDRVADGVRQANAPKPEAEIAAVVGIIRSAAPGILGVQEIGDETQLQLLRARLAAAGLDYPHLKHHRGADETRCLGLLSVYPVVSDQSRSGLAYMLGGAEERMQRGILDVTLQLPDGQALRVAVVHLKSRRPVPQGEELMRRNEAILLRRHLDSILASDPGALLLLLGDLNDTRDQPVVREITGVRGTPGYMADIRAADERGDRWTFYAESADRYERVDYILASPALWPFVEREACRVVHHPLWLAASDHRPVVAVIRIGKRAGSARRR